LQRTDLEQMKIIQRLPGIAVATALLFALTFVAHAQTAPTPDSAPAGNAENGKKLFAQIGCYQCHGYAAQGGVGPRLGPRPLAFTAFSKYLRQPTGEMPPYTAKVVSDAQLADLYAFLRSLPQPPAVDSVPLLKEN
jgi:ubiquinol-cytochrome c reductase cytochrome c subunit